MNLSYQRVHGAALINASSGRNERVYEVGKLLR